MKKIVLEGLGKALGNEQLEWIDAHKLAIAALAEADRSKRTRFWENISLAYGIDINGSNKGGEKYAHAILHKEDDGELVLHLYESLEGIVSNE